MDKSVLKALIYAKGQELGLDQNMIDQMLNSQSVPSQKDQASLQSTQLGNIEKSQSITKAQQAEQDKQAASDVLYKQGKSGKVSYEYLLKTDPQVLQKLQDEGVNIKTSAELTGEQKPKPTAQTAGLVKSGLRNIQEVTQLYNEDPSVLAKQIIPYQPLSRKFDSALYDAVDTLLRLRTGAQANPSEIRGYMEKIGPTFGDSPDVVQFKLNKLQKDLADYVGTTPKEDLKITAKDPVGQFGKNVVTDTGDILNGLLNMPKNIMESNAQKMQQGQMPLNVANLPYELLKGYAGELNQLAGEPLKGGDVLGRIGKRAYEKPVTTTLDLLPFLKLKGGNAKVAEAPVTQEGNALQKIIDIPKKTGEKMVENVRKIDVGASAYGPAREAQIAKTLDEMGIKGSPAQQYSQLQPKISELGTGIKSYLSENAKPVNTTTLKKTFVKNIASELPEETLAVPTVEREVSSFVKQISGKDASKLTTADLFDIKQKINASYSRISSKLDKGLPLTDKEKVVYTARKTIDDIITSEHPQIKQATLKQSNLYEAAKSLYKQRNNAPAFKALGLQIPLPDLRGAQDYIGRILRGK